MKENNPRQYVLVDTAKTVSGIEVPNRIYWFDGRSFEVDGIEQIKPLPKAKDGATLFSVVIGGVRRSVYKDYRGWYVYPRERITDGEMARMKKECVRRTLQPDWRQN
jgi:hypothetical protein